LSVETTLDPTELARFEATVLPHLDAAYTLARYLMRDDDDAQDVAQEALLRALKYFGGFRGGDGRAWVLAIVRNTGRSWYRSRRADRAAVEFDEELHSEATAEDHPEAALLRAASRDTVRRALAALPFAFREVIVLREIQGLSYKEIAEVADIPVGTVMSRLARARERLERALVSSTEGGS
jgi:RNA polymerase sigma-70 factor, ECF subfamily